LLWISVKIFDTSNGLRARLKIYMHPIRRINSIINRWLERYSRFFPHVLCVKFLDTQKSDPPKNPSSAFCVRTSSKQQQVTKNRLAIATHNQPLFPGQAAAGKARGPCRTGETEGSATGAIIA
jgi:hypothetical protein